MDKLAATAAGLILAFLFVSIARGRGRSSARPFAVALIVAAILYVAFAAAFGGSPAWIGLETLGVAIFAAVAWIGLQRSLLLLAAGWTAHVVWDLALHLDGPGATYTPAYYVWLCLGFDLVIAGACVMLERRRS